MSRAYLLGDPKFDETFLLTALAAYVEAYDAALAEAREKKMGGIGADDIASHLDRTVTVNFRELIKNFAGKQLDLLMETLFQSYLDVNDQAPALVACLPALIERGGFTDPLDAVEPLQRSRAIYYITESYAKFFINLGDIFPADLKALALKHSALFDLKNLRQPAKDRLDIKEKFVRLNAKVLQLKIADKKDELQKKLETLYIEKSKCSGSATSSNKAFKLSCQIDTTEYQLQLLEYADYETFPEIYELQQAIDKNIREINHYRQEVGNVDDEISDVTYEADARFFRSSQRARIKDRSTAYHGGRHSPSDATTRARSGALLSEAVFDDPDCETSDDERAAEFRPT
ncbi:MAG: hypothetical protein P1U40_13255 [Coxiellaceae bacterium]|nr:hypothetical protein [Coxiellaceae bacterium]